MEFQGGHEKCMNKKLLPLAILELADNDSIEGITRFQKLVFLAQQEELDEDLYNFIPGSYGPFSKSLYDDIDGLVERGFIQEQTEPSARSENEDKQVYTLGPKGRSALKQAEHSNETPFSMSTLEDLVADYNEMGLWELLEYVYSEYPGMAQNSNLHI
jgi:uncharacterized protein YwgA